MTNDNYRILVFNDSKWRDLPTSMFIKKRLEQELPNALVQVTTFHLWKQGIELFAPHLVILNNMQGQRNHHIASYVKRHGGAVAVMFTEGLVVIEGFAQVFEAQKDSKDVDLFLCWNDIVSDLTGGVSVGCPRFDIYNKPDLIDTREFFCEKWGLDPNKKIILFGDSWPSAKFTYMRKTFHRIDWAATGAGDWMDATEFAEKEHSDQEHFKAMIGVLRLQFGPDIQLVVKAHPMSDYRGWQKWSKATGIKVIHSEYSFNALNACDMYVSKLGSITIEESWLLNKPAIKLVADYDTASSLGQRSADKLNNSWDSLDDLGVSASTMLSLLEADIPAFMEFENDNRDKHLGVWGFNKKDSTGAVVSELLKLLNSFDFALRYKPNFTAFAKAMYEHDLMYSSHAWDGFGNWKKAIVQTDVRKWQRT